MYERGEEIAAAVAEFIRERGYLDGLDDEQYDEVMDGFYDAFEVATLTNA